MTVEEPYKYQVRQNANGKWDAYWKGPTMTNWVDAFPSTYGKSRRQAIRVCQKKIKEHIKKVEREQRGWEVFEYDSGG